MQVIGTRGTCRRSVYRNIRRLKRASRQNGICILLPELNFTLKYVFWCFSVCMTQETTQTCSCQRMKPLHQNDDLASTETGKDLARKIDINFLLPSCNYGELSDRFGRKQGPETTTKTTYQRTTTSWQITRNVPK